MIPWTAAKVKPPEVPPHPVVVVAHRLVRAPAKFPPDALALVPLVHGEVGQVGAVGEVGDRP
jgi:hypothetical protein